MGKHFPPADKREEEDVGKKCSTFVGDVSKYDVWGLLRVESYQ